MPTKRTPTTPSKTTKARAKKVTCSTNATLGDVFAVVQRIEERVGRVEERMDANSTRIDQLIETTNHGLTDFRTDLATKLESKDLLAAFSLHLARTRLFWAGVALFGLISAPVVVDHWRTLFARWGVGG